MIEASLMPLAIFTFFLLVAINDVLRRVAPALALTRAELLLIYVMQTTALGVAGLGQIQFLAQVLGAPFYYASPENDWAATFQRFIPRWWVPDPAVLPAYFKGNSTLFTWAHLAGWALPVMVWTAFILVMLFGFLCLATLLRRHWVENERLPFPLIVLPLALTEEGAAHGLLRHSGFWLAVAGVSVFRSLSALPRIEPRFPAPPLLNPDAGQLIDASGFFAVYPWNAVGYFVLAVHPIIVGITYLLPQEVSFSAWFFYLMVKGENVLSAAMGYRGANASAGAAEIPYTGEQGMGAFIAIGALSLWGARRHLTDTWNKATGVAPQVRDDDEIMSYRTAIFGFMVSVALLVGFAALGGVPLPAAILFFTLYFLMIVTITRLRAEAGPMLNYGPDASPHRLLTQIPGGRVWSAATLTPFSYFHWFDSDYRTVAMPQQLEALKIAESAPGLLARPLARWFLAAGLLASLASFGTLITLYYHYGATTPMGDNEWRNYNGQQPFQILMTTLSDPKPAEWGRLVWVTIGFAATAGLMYARSTFAWWPLHPAGFAMAHAGYTLPWVWFPTFIGWAVKGVLLRYGGVRLYRRALPISLGLIFGDVLMTCLWSLLGLALDTQMYMFFPG